MGREPDQRLRYRFGTFTNQRCSYRRSGELGLPRYRRHSLRLRSAVPEGLGYSNGADAHVGHRFCGLTEQIEQRRQEQRGYFRAFPAVPP